eukprot:UN26658
MITSISMANNNMDGKFPNLLLPPQLEELAVNGNDKLVGPIPPAFPETLIDIQLSGTGLTGRVPTMISPDCFTLYLSKSPGIILPPDIPKEFESLDFSYKKETIQ